MQTKKLKTGAAKPDENTPINAELEALFADIKKNPLAPSAPVPIASSLKNVPEVNNGFNFFFGCGHFETNVQKTAKVPFKEVDVNTVSDNSNTNEVKTTAKPSEKPVTNGSDKPTQSSAKANNAAKVVDMSDSKYLIYSKH